MNVIQIKRESQYQMFASVTSLLSFYFTEHRHFSIDTTHIQKIRYVDLPFLCHSVFLVILDISADLIKLKRSCVVLLIGAVVRVTEVHIYITLILLKPYSL